ncbi:MAG: hypothetical protein B1H09_05695 [Gemmatimonadaceae bacterium 4484_173]|nr:MAG: hypothetical protein B1H09_05695 [Gemmatimonadaceae bacterium 4484_173]RKZ04670.1 MAG: hypothetical protein DRQ21_02085 [Candidatus Fermentibacteria bacterium]
MKRFLIPGILAFTLLFSVSCKHESIGPINGVLVVYSDSLADFIDQGGLQELHLVVETVDPEEVFSFSFAGISEFQGTLKTRRTILFLVDPSDTYLLPSALQAGDSGIYRGEDVWSLDQHVFGVVVDPASPELPSGLADTLESAYNDQMNSYIFESFVSTSMTSPERMDSLQALGFTLNVPKSYFVRIWSPDDGFIQYQRQPDEECLLLFSIRILTTDAELTETNAILAREAMARIFFSDASADSVDRARITAVRVVKNGLHGWELTGVWRNPEYLNAGSFTTRVLDLDGVWYILDMEVYNPGHRKEPYLREGWIIMDTFRKE